MNEVLTSTYKVKPMDFNIDSLFEREFAIVKQDLFQQISLRVEKKREVLSSFVAAVAAFSKPKDLEALVEQKFGCKFEELSEKRKEVFSIVALISQNIELQHVARQMNVHLNVVLKWHEVYKTQGGFTGVKSKMNSRRKSA